MRSVALLASFFTLSMASTPVLGQQPKPIDFAHDIVPLIKARCAECHTNGTYKGSLSLDTRATILKAKVVVPGKSGQSDLIKRITSNDEKERMPLNRERLSAKE